MGSKQFRAELYKEQTMITVQCTYPDGETSEARYSMTLDYALSLFDLFGYE